MDEPQPTMAQLAVRLLRDAAVFFESVGEQNPALADQMSENAEVYRQVAALLEADPEQRIQIADIH